MGKVGVESLSAHMIAWQRVTVCTAFCTVGASSVTFWSASYQPIASIAVSHL